jgi:hypothetical protein
MTLKRTFACAVLLAAGLAAPSPASAAIVSWTLDFSATGFDIPAAPPFPVDTATGTISITFDNTADLFTITTGVALVSSNFTVTDATAFNYDKLLDRITFGGLNIVDTILADSFDYALVVDSISTNPTFFQFYYAYGNPNDTGNTFTGFIEFEPGPGVAIPEPVALSLFGAGLIGLALSRRRRPARAGHLQAG